MHSSSPQHRPTQGEPKPSNLLLQHSLRKAFSLVTYFLHVCIILSAPSLYNGSSISLIALSIVNYACVHYHLFESTSITCSVVYVRIVKIVFTTLFTTMG